MHVRRERDRRRACIAEGKQRNCMCEDVVSFHGPRQGCVEREGVAQGVRVERVRVACSYAGVRRAPGAERWVRRCVRATTEQMTAALQKDKECGGLSDWYAGGGYSFERQAVQQGAAVFRIGTLGWDLF